MSKTKQVNELLVFALPKMLDTPMLAAGFRRPEKSLKYVRKVNMGTQYLDVAFHTSPRYESRALAHVLPRIVFVCPQLNRRLSEIMGDVPSLEDENRVTLNEQIQNAAPRSERSGATTRWFVYDLQNARECLHSIRGFMEKWTIPFLNKYSTLESLARGYEQQDDCLPHDRQFWLFIVAAYTLMGQPQQAMQVLEKSFGRPGARRDYSRAYEYVSAMPPH